MESKHWKTLAFSLVALVVAAVLAQPMLAGDGVEKKVRVKKIVKCEDGDCTEMTEEVEGDDVHVMVGEDGAKHIEIRKMCEGENCEDHEGVHKMVFVGGDGDVKVMSGEGGYAWAHGAHAKGGKGAFLGVGLTELTPELRDHFGVPAGVMVSKIVDGSPAFKAGIMVGDIISGVDGEEVAGGSSLGRMVSSRTAGDTVALEVWRGGSAQTITAAVEERAALHAEHMEHLEQMGGMGKHMRKIMIECDDDDQNCDADIDLAGIDEFDCGSDECEVKVECNDGGCECTINGEDADCSGIPGVPGQ